MFKKLSILFAALFVQLLTANAQQTPIDDNKEMANMKATISYLSSDKLEGRETGTKAEKLAYNYIIEQFKKIGLTPMGTDGYLQEFPFTEGVNYGKGTRLSVNGKTYNRWEDWYVLPYTPNGIEGVSGELVFVNFGISTKNYDNYADIKQNLKGATFLIEISSPDGMTPHSKYKDVSDIRTKIDTAVSRGAAAIIFINSDTTADNPAINFTSKVSPSKIPVIFANSSLASVLKGKVKNCELVLDVTRLTHTGHNVLGYMDNGAKTTVVFGAHYDHLGYGGEGSGSLYRGKPAIHHGADDNASGDAALIELARYLKSSGAKKNNYLFCAFSGEEKGLLGSYYYAKNPTIKLADVDYMFNMDMVGRLKTDEKTLEIGGVGTPPQWHSIVDTIKRDGIKIKTSESGIGPSDHTSFYLQNIPVLFFFTGSHNDYHKPTDTEEKINYQGELSVLKMMISLVENLDGKPKIVFSKTKEVDSAETPRFKVTLGVIPDYAFEGEGMKIDGISEGKPAAKAGLKAGDIVLQMNDTKVTDMMSYMKALGKFKKGDTVNLKIKRGKDMMEVKATF